MWRSEGVLLGYFESWEHRKVYFFWFYSHGSASTIPRGGEINAILIPLAEED